MGALKISEEHNGTAKVLAFEGSIDEDTVFSNLDISHAQEIVLNLDKVAGINSCGIREWIKWLNTRSPSSHIVFQNCPKVIVDQMNMVSGFLPEGAIVESFYVPYYCEESDVETMVPFFRGKEFNGSSVNAPETVPCWKSGQPAEMDVVHAKYFKFLQTQSTM
ncbi:MAG: hypothetical protein COT74_01575 [Bdellovibrionales bacterium CG10_big_fil_rev_8_21_14_0_10_45_34]|nr:MAG: hypothetical protein COT74_01575 [Bdellovibrionales bacterium CG10_big_fil_rev_8_21_14_0_10_45_34]